MTNQCEDKMCCCKCKYQLQLNKHPLNKDFGKGSILEQLGYVCLNPDMMPEAIYFDKPHGCCECFELREDVEAPNSIKDSIF